MELRNIDKAFSLIIEYKEEKARLESLEYFEKEIQKNDSLYKKIKERMQERKESILALEYEIKAL
ncbi:hypothetical protein FSBG_00147 [Fusobacterium gonidiaformans 3-1-5R]|uniref:Uncharacterized protein n=1 Tax=Fusobacterium gonidiaformans 3-1-5R TaxID=469605 RepID=E5BEW9_9FUSO|nr:hypothetical protein [Fusobacterium gonidiaformans]EFS20650.1 hypothetical protein FSBG_00147 [Fusobacterium gonidiaformans 3-1-5R]